MTLLTTLLDFSDTGILDIFIDEAMVQVREMTLGPKSGRRRPAQGQELASTFSFLRPNDLVWNYVVGNYLKGETPPPFDLLYWNSDSTNLPGPMYCWYLRNTYHENKLMQPGALTVCGERSTSARSRRRCTSTPRARTTSCPGTRLCLDPAARAQGCVFVMGASGHIAGVINPPAKGKRSHWIGNGTQAARRRLVRQGQEHPGSWWTDWADWLKPHAGKDRRAQGPGNRKYKAIEPAPGRYVKAGLSKHDQGLATAPTVRTDRPSTFRFHPGDSPFMAPTSSSSPPPAPRSASSAARWPDARARTGATVINELLKRARLDQGRRGHPGPGAAGRRGPEPGAPGGDEGRVPHGNRAGDDHQQGLRLGPEGGDAGRAGDPRRRQRDRHRRRQENMSLSPHVLPNSRDGQRMGDWKMVDSMIVDGLWDVYNQYHMGITAENVPKSTASAARQQDALALASQQKAAAAQDAGRFRTRSFRC